MNLPDEQTRTQITLQSGFGPKYPEYAPKPEVNPLLAGIVCVVLCAIVSGLLGLPGWGFLIMASVTTGGSLIAILGEKK